MIVGMTEQGGWRCPLCGASAASGVEHLRSEHGMGGSREDRFGLRDAVRPSLDEAPPARRVGGLSPLRPSERRRRRDPAAEEIGPARPAPLPPDAAVLRLVCESLDDVDVALLQARLAELAGVDSVAVDVYQRTIDLYLDRARAAPPHLATLATERLGLPVMAAELHRAPRGGGKLGLDTLILNLR